MPSKPQGDLLREHGERLATLDERIDQIRRDSVRIELAVARLESASSEIDQRLVVTIRDVEKLEQKLDEIHSRRWDLWKLVLAAVLGACLTVGTGLVGKLLDRLTPRAPVPNR